MDVYAQLIEGLRNTPPLEYIAVFFGIASVMFSRKENILVYPTGLINTGLYTWFCFQWWGLYAEGSLNFYYTVMGVYGWYAWSHKKHGKQLFITYNGPRDWAYSISFFVIAWGVLYFILKQYTDSTVPVADSFASATAYTGMWQMTRKKMENWIWWMMTNAASIPLYFYKGAVFTSFQYIVFLVLSIMGWITWKRKMNHARS